MKSSFSTYPFGSPMPAHSFSASSYKYGFNGKEKDDEVKGESNSVDYGARIYDSRLGRWLAVDPLFAKYPYQSPYAYVGNSPILNQEFGGKDYGVYVNHTIKTITIKATFYTPKGDTDSHNEAVAATQFWNSQSDKYQYRVENSNGSYTFYDVKFIATTEELPDGKTVSKNSTAIVAYETGVTTEEINKTGGQESNLFSVKSDDDVFFKQGTKSKDQADNRGGLTVNEVDVAVKKSKTGTGAGKHEVGHAFGAGHLAGTIMATSISTIKSFLNSNIIRNILGNVGLGNTFSKGENINPGTGKVVEEIGAKPENFDKGKVVEK